MVSAAVNVSQDHSSTKTNSWSSLKRRLSGLISTTNKPSSAACKFVISSPVIYSMSIDKEEVLSTRKQGRSNSLESCTSSASTSSDKLFQAITQDGFSVESTNSPPHLSYDSPTTQDDNNHASYLMEFNSHSCRPTSNDQSGSMHFAVTRWSKRLGKTEWDDILPHIKCPGRTTNEALLYKKILQRKLPVNAYSVPSNSLAEQACTSCSHPVETIEHLLFECETAQHLWIHFKPILETSLDKRNLDSITLRDVVYFFPELRQTIDLTEDDVYFLQMIHSCAIWALWNCRAFPGAPKEFAFEMFKGRLESKIALDLETVVRQESDLIFSASFSPKRNSSSVSLLTERPFRIQCYNTPCLPTCFEEGVNMLISPTTAPHDYQDSLPYYEYDDDNNTIVAAAVASDSESVSESEFDVAGTTPPLLIPIEPQSIYENQPTSPLEEFIEYY